MKIFEQEFDFSPLNANDIERMEQAKAQLDREAEAERQRLQRERVSYADGLRGQCRLLMHFLDGVLGDGASARLGLDGNDLGKALEVVVEMTRVVNEGRKKFALPAAPIPQNRAQRRQQKKHTPRSRSEGFGPAVQMVERVDDKAARRAELLRELNALKHA
jgi:hypothetical protein|nr:MAG TPA: hypothetical protein [Caudoviricetes sp.]